MPGLAVDTELRWQLLHRLVSRGLAGPQAIDAELARDATDAGERYAQMCRAAIPAPEAKAASWAAIVSGTLPNATFRAVLRGFADPDQDDLLAPYAERYFAALPGMWQDGASDMAQFFARVAYPATVISQQAMDGHLGLHRAAAADARAGPAARGRTRRRGPRAALPAAVGRRRAPP